MHYQILSTRLLSLTSRLRIMHCLRFLRVLRVLLPCHLLLRLLPLLRPLVLSSCRRPLLSTMWLSWLSHGVQRGWTEHLLLLPFQTHFSSLSLRRSSQRPRPLLSAQQLCRPALDRHQDQGDCDAGIKPDCPHQVCEISFEVSSALLLSTRTLIPGQLASMAYRSGRVITIQRVRSLHAQHTHRWYGRTQQSVSSRACERFHPSKRFHPSSISSSPHQGMLYSTSRSGKPWSITFVPVVSKPESLSILLGKELSDIFFRTRRH